MSQNNFNNDSTKLSVLNDAQRGKMALMSNANRKGQDQHAHPCSLILAFSVRQHILQYPLILKAGNESPDQPTQMRRLIRACVARILYKGHNMCCAF